jgi:hypothetical protein
MRLEIVIHGEQYSRLLSAVQQNPQLAPAILHQVWSSEICAQHARTNSPHLTISAFAVQVGVDCHTVSSLHLVNQCM